MSATLRAAAGRLVHHALARQVLGQRARSHRALSRDGERRSRRDRRCGLELVQGELQLLDLALKALRGAAELHAPQFGDEERQRFDLPRPCIQKRPVLEHHALERFDVFGEIAVGVVHACDC
jgi:hypothetical protein